MPTMTTTTTVSLLLSVIFCSVCLGTASNADPTETLFQAIDAGDVGKVRDLFSVSVRPNLFKANEQGKTPLLVAAEKGHAEIVQTLLERGAEINDAGPDKNTALHYAAQNGHINAVETLTRNGANDQQKNGSGLLPVDLAGQNGHEDVVEALRPATDDYYGGPGSASGADDTNAERAALDTLSDILKDPEEILKRVLAVPDLPENLKKLATACDKEELKWINKKVRVKSRFAAAILSQIDKELVLVADAATKDSAEKTAEKTKAMQARWKKRIREFSKQMRDQLRTGDLTGGNTQQVGRRGSRGRGAGRGGRTSSRTTRSSARGGRGSTDGYDDQMYPGSGREPDGPSPEEQEEERLVNNWARADEGNMDTLYKTVHDKALAEYAGIREEATVEEAENTIATIDGLLLARLNRLNKGVAVIQANKAELDAQQRPGMGPDEPGRGGRGRGRRTR